MKAALPPPSKRPPSEVISPVIGSCLQALSKEMPLSPVKQGNDTDVLKAALTQRYFADYADHWQGFMNALQWEPANELPAAIEQLKLMADARQSPVIALMKSVKYQGEAGVVQDSLSDTASSQGANGI